MVRQDVLSVCRGYCVQVSTQGVPETYFKPGVAVPEVNRNSPAAAAGLRRGDIILKLQNIDVPANPAAVPGVVRYITCVLSSCFALSVLSRFLTTASAVFKPHRADAVPEQRLDFCLLMHAVGRA